nr:interleukin-21 receptor-like [Nerophis lumbriciformis]
MAAVVWMLWSLALYSQSVDSSICNVTCFTDYKILVNCSCAGVPARQLRLRVNCSDGELTAADGCHVTPPRSWCVTYPAALYDIAAVGTECTTAVGTQEGPDSEFSSWALYDAVKPPPPYNVRVTGSSDDSYNITWEHDDAEYGCLQYSLRIRGPSLNPARSFPVDATFLTVRRESLPPQAEFRADVRGKLCPDNPAQGPWSEWSSSVNWTPASIKSADIPVRGSRLPALLVVLVTVAALLLACSRNPLLLKRIRMSTYVSRPHDFFKPLYLNYGGDFKEWVKPTFSEHDLLRNTSPTDPTATVDKPISQGDHDDTPRLLRCPILSMGKGHVSIHTVTVQEDDDNGPDFEPPAEEDALSDDGEAEKSCLSDDGYPRLDLDTADSGFGECASPTQSSSGQPADFLDDGLISRSNYVKQWIMGNDAQDALTSTLE